MCVNIIRNRYFRRHLEIKASITLAKHDGTYTLPYRALRNEFKHADKRTRGTSFPNRIMHYYRQETATAVRCYCV